MKKLIWLGSLSASIISTSTIISCANVGEVEDAKIEPPIKEKNIEDFKKSVNTLSQEWAETKNDLKHNFKINNHEVIVKNEMSIITNQSYNGWINESQNGYKNVDSSHQSFSKNVSLLGKGDSIIYLFDEDETDGLSVNNFVQTHFLGDTSVSPSFVELYKKLGYKSNSWGTLYIPFDPITRATKTYFGSQSNHETTQEDGAKINSWDEAFDYLKAHGKMSDEKIKIMQKYYETANHVFTPVYIPNKLVTYKQIAKNAIQVTFNPYSGFSMTAAMMVTIKEGESKVTENGYIMPLSIGGQNEWSAYVGKPSKYTFNASKDNLEELIINIKDGNSIKTIHELIKKTIKKISYGDILKASNHFQLSKLSQSGRYLMSVDHKQQKGYFWSLQVNGKDWLRGIDSLYMELGKQEIDLIKIIKNT